MKRLLLPLLLAIALGGCAPMRIMNQPFHSLVLLEDCREEPAVELVCQVAPKGFPEATFDLVVRYRTGSIEQMKKATKVAKRLLNTPAHQTFRVQIAALPPDEPATRRFAYLGK